MKQTKRSPYGQTHNRPIPPTKLYSPQVRALVLAGMPPRWLFLHTRRTYVEQKIRATPPWVSHKDFLELQARKIALHELTGEPHTLDHIIPLNHPDVCGLNVPWNIQVIPAKANARKGNKWSPNQIEIELSASASCAEHLQGDGHETRQDRSSDC